MTTEVMVNLAWFSLAWFILGVIAGKYLPRPTSKRRRTKGGKKRSSRGSGRPPARSGGGADVVELYVGNLSYDMRERDLRDEFQKHGQVVAARLIKNRGSGKSKGYGFVEMASAKDADSAIDAMNGADLKGRKLVVNEAKSDARSR